MSFKSETGGTSGSSPSAHAPKQIPYSEVQKHASADSCWVIIEGQVYDVTSFLSDHPGGAGVIVKNSGRDATKAFAPIHPPGTLSMLDTSAHLGPVDPATIPTSTERITDEERRIQKARAELPPPEGALNLQDIETFAQRVLSNTAWGYYRSAGDDENTLRGNSESFSHWWFRPRVLNKISGTDLSTTMLGMPLSLPIFIAPAALARLGHPDGEMNLTRAAGKAGIVQGISNNASCSIDEIISVKTPEQGLVFQLYMNKDRKASETLIKGLESRGFSAIMLTVDAAVAGNRELDKRAKGDVGSAAPAQNGSAATGLGVAHAIMGYQDPDVCWDDLHWIQSLTRLPLLLKGIQCVEDAERAYAAGMQGIVLSNHGGRSLDFAPPPMEILRELNELRPDLVRNPRFEILLDGGIKRGTDIIKALCLGAKAVGLGRAFLYANGVWGEAGCTRVIEILREEMTTSMRLLGVTHIHQLGPHLVRHNATRGHMAKL